MQTPPHQDAAARRPGGRRRLPGPAVAAGALLVVVGSLLAPLLGGGLATPASAEPPGAVPVGRTPPTTPTAFPTTTATASPGPSPVPTDPGPPPASMVAGYDISWPQCPVSQGGYANPMPRPRASFVIIGLSRGSAFTANPCLASQVAWARANHVYVASYVFPTYPTNAEYAAYGATGPYPTSTVTGRLMNVGWQQATYWVALKNRTGLTTPMVWVDVEQKRTALRWPARPSDRNLPVLRGLLAGLAHAGLRTGIYTTPSHWQEITGGVDLGQPEWRTVGGRTATEALAACSAPGVQGTQVLVAQYYTNLPANNYDYDVLCPLTRTGGRLTQYFTKY